MVKLNLSPQRFVPAVVLAYLVTGSTKVFSIVLATFGLLFALAPSQAAAVHWRFLGYALLLIAPIAYVLARD